MFWWHHRTNYANEVCGCFEIQAMNTKRVGIKHDLKEKKNIFLPLIIFKSLMKHLLSKSMIKQKPFDIKMMEISPTRLCGFVLRAKALKIKLFIDILTFKQLI